MSNKTMKSIIDDLEDYRKKTGEDPDVILIRDSMLRKLQEELEYSGIIKKDDDLNKGERRVNGILLFSESEALHRDWRGYSVMTISICEAEVIAVMMAYNMQDGLTPVTPEIIKKMRIDENKLSTAFKIFSTLFIGSYHSSKSVRTNLMVAGTLRLTHPDLVDHQIKYQSMRKSNIKSS